MSLEEWISPPPNTTKTIRNDAPRQAMEIQEANNGALQTARTHLGSHIRNHIVLCPGRVRPDQLRVT
ncbi:hypothetical protein CCP3SC15_4450003 [Gammaproteobacteria bacterium]